MGRETEARDFADIGSARNFALDEIRIEAIEQRRPGRVEQPRRSEVTALSIGDDEIDGGAVIELIEFEAIRQDRQIPAEKVDEDLLARFEHGSEGSPLAEAIGIIDDQKHWIVSRSKETVQMKRKRPRRYNRKRGYPRSATSPKCSVPSNRARTASLVRVAAS